MKKEDKMKTYGKEIKPRKNIPQEIKMTHTARKTK